MKTTLAISSGIAISLFLLFSPRILAADLKITIEDIVEQEGHIIIAVLSSEQQFGDEAAASASLITAPLGETTSITLRDVNPGFYAIRVLHDVNGNNKMDTNFVGMPKEPWGFSNNAKGKFGPPKWSAARFEVKSDTQATINLNR